MNLVELRVQEVERNSLMQLAANGCAGVSCVATLSAFLIAFIERCSIASTCKLCVKAMHAFFCVEMVTLGRRAIRRPQSER